MEYFIDETTLAYPLARWDIKRLNPNMSLPKPSIAPAGYALVHRTPQPGFDRITQTVREGDPVLDGNTWVQTWVVESLTPEQVEANIETAKASLIDAATNKRWEVETGGMTLPGDVHVATGTEDQNRITSVIANAERAGVATVDFKAASGWVTLTLAELKGIADAIALHVQACFSAERAHHEAIDKLKTPEQINDYDVNSGWPNQSE